jgi:Icc-related predicted phosphoesterase
MPNMHALLSSDIHNRHKQIKLVPCDLFAVVGDATNQGEFREVNEFAKWFAKYPARHKIFVPGNHEREFEKRLPESLTWIKEKCPDAHILINDTVEIEGRRIHGFSYTPVFFRWAFMRNDELEGDETVSELGRQAEGIPEGLDLLLSHGPPWGILDANKEAERCGSKALLERVMLVKPKRVVFGHIHLGGGKSEKVEGIEFYNVAAVQEPGTIDGPYRVINQPLNLNI